MIRFELWLLARITFRVRLRVIGTVNVFIFFVFATLNQEGYKSVNKNSTGMTTYSLSLGESRKNHETQYSVAR